MSSGSSTSLLFQFTLSEINIDIPYTALKIRLGSPWAEAVSLGPTVVYGLLFLVIWPYTFSGAIKARKQAGKRSEVMTNGPLTQLHFVALFVYSMVVWLATTYHLISSGELFSYDSMMCSPPPTYLRFLALTFALSKIWEWGDTLVHFSKGQSCADIGFLHSYHHATTFVLFLIVNNFPSAEKLGMLLNGFVHSLMYYHFAFRLPRWARPLITSAQLVQFAIVIYVWNFCPKACKQLNDWPQKHPIEFALPYAMVPVYTAFFIKFFFENYVFKKKTEKQHKDE